MIVRRSYDRSVKPGYRAYLVVSHVLFVIINWLLASRNLVIRLL